jgi:hypothetical protein
MKLPKLMLLFGTLTLAVASAASTYHLTLDEPSSVGGTVLKPGDYKLQVDGQQATIKNGKDTVQAAVKVETAEQKFATTSVVYANADGKYRIAEIRLGGTNTKILFN